MALHDNVDSSPPTPTPKAKGKAVAEAAAAPKRPPINASLLLDPTLARLPPLSLDLAQLPPHSAGKWDPLASCDSFVPLSTWLAVVELHIEFPERSSSSILRSEVISDQRIDATPETPSGSTWTLQRKLITRILPRRARLDAPMIQQCLFYARHSPETGERTDVMIVYVPMVATEDLAAAQLPTSADEVPYYFPKVKALAIRYESVASPSASDAASTSSDSTPKALGRCQLDVILFPSDLDESTSQPTLSPTSRLSRTALSLLTLQQTHAWGEHHSYAKRVTHDVLVDRALYLDTYSALKWRHAKRLVGAWTERTDPAKHVFEDLGIAAFLMTLWKGMFQGTAGSSAGDPPWRSWGRPAGGFVDVGCGNGLLVHILNAEGYRGFGVDLRARKSWAVWREQEGGADLRTVSIDAPGMVLESLGGEGGAGSSSLELPHHSWLVGNHADELTPWLPLIAASTPDCAGFLNLPCCAWKLDGSRFTAKQTAVREEEVAGLLFPDCRTLNETEARLLQETIREVRRGPQANVSSAPTSSSSDSGTTSRTAAYLAHISLAHLEAGWKLEKEALRIPSTRNWALIGRQRLWEDDRPGCRDRAAAHAEHVRHRLVALARLAQPLWTARTPEGNAGRDAH